MESGRQGKVHIKKGEGGYRKKEVVRPFIKRAILKGLVITAP
ncbi:MAG: hypothetical protein ACJA2Q_000407 [Pseudohongiellaceae bacterium]|jgi:hypothetical protein